jgi:hypothetical protein
MAKMDCTNEKMVWMMLVKISKMEPTRSEKALTTEDMVVAGPIAGSGSVERRRACFQKGVMRLAVPGQCSELETANKVVGGFGQRRSHLSRPAFPVTTSD